MQGAFGIMTPFDEVILPKELKMLKAFLPFLPANMQKPFAFFIKWTELRCTMDYFNRNLPTQQSLEAGNLLDCMKGFLPAQEQAQMEQFADIFENMDMYRDMFEGFASAADPEQKEDDT
jgi:hypothetical protein